MSMVNGAFSIVTRHTSNISPSSDTCPLTGTPLSSMRMFSQQARAS